MNFVHILRKKCKKQEKRPILHSIFEREVKNGRFEPSHSLALATKKGDWKNAVDLEETDACLDKYLRGETMETAETPKNGWCVVCAAGFPVGLGKAVNGTIKNHIPKGIRKN